MRTALRISGTGYNALKKHLFSGDGKESVSIALCGTADLNDLSLLTVHKVINIPIEQCSVRTETRVTWSTQNLIPLLEEALKRGMSIVKFHSHPNGFSSFSAIDDKADHQLFESVYGWLGNSLLHASVIMLPDGKMIGRTINYDLSFSDIERITVVGDDIKYFVKDEAISSDFSLRTKQAFGEGTTGLLKQLTVAIIGCSGTGSPVFEQCLRLGFGKIILIDPDKVEIKNLNRIIASTSLDCVDQKFKVDMLKEYGDSVGLGVEIVAYPVNLYDDMAVINEVIGSDLIFGCMDSVDGRQLLNSISTFYLIPYIDLGVKLVADGIGGISSICGTVNYLQPGLSSLFTRGLYDMDDLAAAALFRADPEKYQELKKEGYIKNVVVASPAVIPVNMLIASAAVMEFLARVHPFRYDPNGEAAIMRISLSDCYIMKEGEAETDPYLAKMVGRGDIVPFLNMPEFVRHEKV